MNPNTRGRGLGGWAAGFSLIAGVGILQTSKRKEAAAKFVTWLLEPGAQEYFSSKNYFAKKFLRAKYKGFAAK